jgi:hypothetical protein
MAEYEVDRQKLIEAIRYDCVACLGFYLGPELELEVPEFHVDLWEELLDVLEQVNHPDHMTGILKKLLAVPREHAKTTLTKVAMLIFLRYSRLSFLAYTSNTNGAALNAIRDIKNWFLGEKDQLVYGVAEVIKSSESDSLYILDICTPLQLRRKRIIMKAYGQGTQIRGTLIEGRRPDLLVFDDIESRETAESAVQQAKVDAWCLGTALKSMARRGVCIFIGNMISDTTLLARLAKEASWSPTVLGSIVRTPTGLRPLWEGRWTVPQLLEDYMSYRRLGHGHIWEAEMMNLTNREVFGESLEDAIRPPRPVAEDIEAGFLCCDPAFGLKAWNDESAITVHVRLVGGDIPVLVESHSGRWSQDRLFDEMLGMALRWGIRTWVIEAEAAQRLLIPYFRALCLQRKISPDLFHFLPILAGQKSKASRILAFRSAVAGGSYAVVDSEEELCEKLEAYVPTSTEHDDLCDSAAYGLQIWALYGEMIRAMGKMDVAGVLFGQSTGQVGDGVALHIP